MPILFLNCHSQCIVLLCMSFAIKQAFLKKEEVRASYKKLIHIYKNSPEDKFQNDKFCTQIEK